MPGIAARRRKLVPPGDRGTAARPLGGVTIAATVAALRGCANQFGAGHTAQKAALLHTCAAHEIVDADVLLAYHDCLLFLLAYPESAATHRLATGELRRVAAAARTMIEHGTARTRATLANSGVAWAPMTIAFGHDIARWLVRRYPRHAEIDSFDEAGAPLAGVLRHALPPLEFELLAADDTDAAAFLADASAGNRGTRLQWLVAQFARLPCSDELREHLFDSLHAYITIKPGATLLSRTFVRGLPGRTHYHRQALQRHVDPPQVLATPLAPGRKLSRAQQMRLLDAGRAMLAALGRDDYVVALEIAAVPNR